MGAFTAFRVDVNMCRCQEAYQQGVLSDRLCGNSHDSGNVGMPQLHPLGDLIHCLHDITAN